MVLTHGCDGTIPPDLTTRVVVIGTRELIYHNPQAEEHREDDMVDSPDGSGPEDVQMGATRETNRDGYGPPELTDTHGARWRFDRGTALWSVIGAAPESRPALACLGLLANLNPCEPPDRRPRC